MALQVVMVPNTALNEGFCDGLLIAINSLPFSNMYPPNRRQAVLAHPQF